VFQRNPFAAAQPLVGGNDYSRTTISNATRERLRRKSRKHNRVNRTDARAGRIAQTQAALSAKTPVELLAKQTELGTQLGEKLRTRAQEFSTLASEAQGSAAAFATETTNRASAFAKKMAA
jgi:Phasin protein